jgi:hypothetical protein
MVIPSENRTNLELIHSDPLLRGGIHMRDWTVTGTDRSTGVDRVMAIVALTEDEAREEASAAGLSVENVVERYTPPESRTLNASSRLQPSRRTPQKYVDHLRVPRLVLLGLALACSLLSMFSSTVGSSSGSWILWAAWIALGIVSIVKKANWKERQNLQ